MVWNTFPKLSFSKYTLCLLMLKAVAAPLIVGLPLVSPCNSVPSNQASPTHTENLKFLAWETSAAPANISETWDTISYKNLPYCWGLPRVSQSSCFRFAFHIHWSWKSPTSVMNPSLEEWNLFKPCSIGGTLWAVSSSRSLDCAHFILALFMDYNCFLLLHPYHHHPSFQE